MCAEGIEEIQRHVDRKLGRWMVFCARTSKCLLHQNRTERWGQYAQLNKEAGLADLCKYSLSRGGFQVYVLAQGGGGDYGGHFLLILSTYIHGLWRKALPFPTPPGNLNSGVLNMAMCVSTAHIKLTQALSHLGPFSPSGCVAC